MRRPGRGCVRGGSARRRDGTSDRPRWSAPTARRLAAALRDRPARGPRDASSSIVGGFTTIPPVGLTDFIRNLVSPRDPLDRVATYVLREHERGRQLQEILDDPYVTNRTNVEQRARLLD